MRLCNVVENAGEVDASSICALCDALDIFGFSSSVESFGFPLIEAMARGFLIAAGDTPSNRELAGDTAAYFSPNNAEALARLLGEMIDNVSLRRAKSAAALHRVQDLSWQ